MFDTFNCQTFLLYLYMKTNKEKNEGNKRMAIFLDYSYHPWNEKGFIAGWWDEKDHKNNFICRSHKDLPFQYNCCIILINAICL